MALLVVLWAVAILALISASFMTTTRTEINRARNLVENAKAEALADAGIYRAIEGLLEPNSLRHPRTDGTTYQWSLGGAAILICIRDEAGKIDLNVASDQLLAGLLNSVGVAPEDAQRLVDAIRDFADADSLVRLNGAEDGDYRALGMLDGAKDGPFQSVEELRQVLGITPELYAQLAPALTVYSGRRSLDPTTAPREALLALPGVTLAQVDAMLEARRAVHQGEEIDSLLRVDDLAGFAEQAEFDQAAGRRRGYVFTITAVAQTPGGGIFERLAVVRLTDDPAQPFVFHEWLRTWTLDATAASPGGDE